MSLLMAALPPAERRRLARVLARPPRDADERDRLVREAVERVEADLQALKDVLGIAGDEGGGDARPSDA